MNEEQSLSEMIRRFLISKMENNTKCKYLKKFKIWNLRDTRKANMQHIKISEDLSTGNVNSSFFQAVNMKSKFLIKCELLY